MNPFFNSQFNYCPAIWMFHCGVLFHMNVCLHIIHNDKTSTFNELQENDNSVSIRCRNSQALAIEMHKRAKAMSPHNNEIFLLAEESH